jgi:ribulose-5-phosphate 4-epimerase/fuculose-1-phosphate aldolase
MTVAAFKLEKGTSLKGQVSEAEWRARVDLAAAHRGLAHYGVDDLTYNHLSVRVPDEPDKLLIKPFGFMFGEVTASSLEKFAFDGTPAKDGDEPLPPLKGGGLVIHAGILKARADVNVVFHTHTPAAMGVAAQKHGLLPLNQHAMRFFERIRYHDFGGFEFDPAMRDPLLEDLGADGWWMLLRNHGALICAKTIPEAFTIHHYLEMACRGQIAALSAGEGNVVMPPREVCEFSRDQIENTPHAVGDKDWPAVLRLCERTDPGYRN